MRTASLATVLLSGTCIVLVAACGGGESSPQQPATLIERWGTKPVTVRYVTSFDPSPVSSQAGVDGERTVLTEEPLTVESGALGADSDFGLRFVVESGLVTLYWRSADAWRIDMTDEGAEAGVIRIANGSASYSCRFQSGVGECQPANPSEIAPDAADSLFASPEQKSGLNSGLAHVPGPEISSRRIAHEEATCFVASPVATAEVALPVITAQLVAVSGLELKWTPDPGLISVQLQLKDWHVQWCFSDDGILLFFGVEGASGGFKAEADEVRREVSDSDLGPPYAVKETD